MKLHDGIRFLERDLRSIHTQIMAYRPVIAEKGVDLEKGWITRIAIATIDDAFADDNPDGAKDALFNAQQRLWEEQAKQKVPGASPNPFLNVEFSVVAMPYCADVFGMVFTHQRAWQNAFMEAGICEPYWYWTNTDRDENVSQAEWDERGIVWSGIWEQAIGAIPSSLGMTFEFPIPAYVITQADFLERLPSLEKRVERIATNRVYQRSYKAAMEGPDFSIFDPAARRKSSAYLKTEAGLEEMRQERERVAGILPVIDKDFLKKY